MTARLCTYQEVSTRMLITFQDHLFPSRFDQALAMADPALVALSSVVDTSVNAQGSVSLVSGIGTRGIGVATSSGSTSLRELKGDVAGVSVVTRGSSGAHDSKGAVVDDDTLPPLVSLRSFVEAPRRVKVTKLVELAQAAEHCDATALDMAKRFASKEAQVKPDYRVKLSQEIVRLQYQDPHLRNVADWLVNGVDAKGYGSWSRAYRGAMGGYRFGRQRASATATRSGVHGKPERVLSARILKEVVTTRRAPLVCWWFWDGPPWLG
eukprot:m.55068 g.55068  ORF g.55068 m.55068 type:complete len:266 (+) comp13649_c0_seq31:676-1473(+)